MVYTCVVVRTVGQIEASSRRSFFAGVFWRAIASLAVWVIAAYTWPVDLVPYLAARSSPLQWDPATHHGPLSLRWFSEFSALLFIATLAWCARFIVEERHRHQPDLAIRDAALEAESAEERQRRTLGDGSPHFRWPSRLGTAVVITAIAAMFAATGEWVIHTFQCGRGLACTPFTLFASPAILMLSLGVVFAVEDLRLAGNGMLVTVVVLGCLWWLLSAVVAVGW